MSRAPFQILALPFYIHSDGAPRFALFKRAKGDYWQGIAGGGKNVETPLEAAVREAFEEAGLDETARFYPLQSMTMIPVSELCGFIWGEDVLVVPEHAFAVHVANPDRINISAEHSEYGWFDFEEASARVRWDSNRTALWEINHLLTVQKIPVQ